MARGQKQAAGQLSMEDIQPKKRRFFIPRGLKKVAEQSTSEKTVFWTQNGKKIEVETNHGKFKRFQKEIKDGKHSVTGQTLSEADVAYRKGVVNTMGAQAREYKRKHST